MKFNAHSSLDSPPGAPERAPQNALPWLHLRAGNAIGASASTLPRHFTQNAAQGSLASRLGLISPPHRRHRPYTFILIRAGAARIRRTIADW
jgi:hypothetical protein